MNIAIMGAGLSGLSCAITLEKYGIKPTVFEKRNRVGDRFVNGEATFYGYEELCKEFEYVILATGDGAYAAEIGNYRCDLTCTIKGATVTGEFLTNIAHPDYPSNIKLDINNMWKTLVN